MLRLASNCVASWLSFFYLGAVIFEEVWTGFPEEVILGEESFNIFCFFIKESLLKFFREGGENVVGWSGRFGEFLRRWSSFQFLSEVTDLVSSGCRFAAG